MNLVNKLGPPSLFITMTANPNWEEIQNKLGPNKYWYNRPDLVSRVFRLEKNSLIDDITKNHIFGQCVGGLIVTRFQKQGLPHAHILIVL